MSYFIPDSILDELRSGIVHHLEYDRDCVAVFFADGEITHFSATATPEMIEANRQQGREDALAHGAMIIMCQKFHIDFHYENGIVINAGV